MVSLIDKIRASDSGGPEITAGAALVTHVANVFRTQEDALDWVNRELAAGNLKTKSGSQIFVLEEAAGNYEERAGELPEEEPPFSEPLPPGLQIRDQDGQRTIFEVAEGAGSGPKRKFLVGIALRKLVSEGQAKNAAAALRTTKLMCVVIYLAIWILISLHLMREFRVNVWIFVFIGVLIAGFLYFQINEIGTVESESALFDRLRIILISVSGVFVSLVVFASESPILDRPLTAQIMLIGLVVTFATFAINPRRTDLKVLRWMNNIMRITIAVSVSCIAAAILTTLVGYVHQTTFAD